MITDVNKWKYYSNEECNNWYKGSDVKVEIEEARYGKQFWWQEIIIQSLWPGVDQTRKISVVSLIIFQDQPLVKI